MYGPEAIRTRVVQEPIFGSCRHMEASKKQAPRFGSPCIILRSRVWGSEAFIWAPPIEANPIWCVGGGKCGAAEAICPAIASLRLLTGC